MAYSLKVRRNGIPANRHHSLYKLEIIVGELGTLRVLVEPYTRVAYVERLECLGKWSVLPMGGEMAERKVHEGSSSVAPWAIMNGVLGVHEAMGVGVRKLHTNNSARETVAITECQAVPELPPLWVSGSTQTMRAPSHCVWYAHRNLGDPTVDAAPCQNF